jgi:hypothetical protein
LTVPSDAGADLDTAARYDGCSDRYWHGHANGNCYGHGDAHSDGHCHRHGCPRASCHIVGDAQRFRDRHSYSKWDTDGGRTRDANPNIDPHPHRDADPITYRDRHLHTGGHRESHACSNSNRDPCSDLNGHEHTDTNATSDRDANADASHGDTVVHTRCGGHANTDTDAGLDGHSHGDAHPIRDTNHYAFSVGHADGDAESDGDSGSDAYSNVGSVRTVADRDLHSNTDIRQCAGRVNRTVRDTTGHADSDCDAERDTHRHSGGVPDTDRHPHAGGDFGGHSN